MLKILQPKLLYHLHIIISELGGCCFGTVNECGRDGVALGSGARTEDAVQKLPTAHTEYVVCGMDGCCKCTVTGVTLCVNCDDLFARVSGNEICVHHGVQSVQEYLALSRNTAEVNGEAHDDAVASCDFLKQTVIDGAAVVAAAETAALATTLEAGNIYFCTWLCEWEVMRSEFNLCIFTKEFLCEQRQSTL